MNQPVRVVGRVCCAVASSYSVAHYTQYHHTEMSVYSTTAITGVEKFGLVRASVRLSGWRNRNTRARRRVRFPVDVVCASPRDFSTDDREAAAGYQKSYVGNLKRFSRA